MRILPYLVAAWLVGGAAAAQAQWATERYIPIGQSPGISGKVAMIGTVSQFEGGTLTLAVPGHAGPYRMQVTPATRIWLDRSAARQSTLDGTVSDLRAGRRVEIKFADERNRSAAHWIKVDMASVP